MTTDAVNLLVRRLTQSALLQPAQLNELNGPLPAQFPDPRALAQEIVRRGWLTIYQVQQVALGKGSELTLGPYVLMEKLGEGGMGQVFKARHQRLGRVVALKVVRPDLLADAEVVNRFYREIEVISRISHPNIVHAYDAGPIGSAMMLSMEFVDGIDLDKMVQQNGPLPIAQACEYIRQAACGLQHAHEKGLVHRDIKPSNLLLAKAQGAQSVGVVKILDMGLARLHQPAPGSKTRNLTVLGNNSWTMGTPDYLSPEQAIEFHRADIRSDIYSLGCTLYFLLTGKPPFEGTLPELLLKHQQVEPKRLEVVRPDAPPEVQQVLDRMLAKLAVDRYQTPGELADALAELIPTLPAPATAHTTAIHSNPGSTVNLPALPTKTDEVLVEPAAEEKPENPLRNKSRRNLFIVLFGFFLVFVLLAVLSQMNSSGGVTSPTVASGPSTVPQTLPPTEPAPTLPGVTYAYYEGNFNKLPQFDTMSPVKMGTAKNFNLKDRKRDQNFAFVYTGFLTVTKPGKHSFTVKSDDGARLFIGDKKIVDDDGPHSAHEKSGDAELTAGKHAIKVQFYQGTGVFILEVRWQEPGAPAKVLIPDSALTQ